MPQCPWKFPSKAPSRHRPNQFTHEQKGPKPSTGERLPINAGINSPNNMFSQLPPNYNKFPKLSVDAPPGSCVSGWAGIVERLRGEIANRSSKRAVLAVECYAGVHVSEVVEGLKPLGAALVIESAAAFLPEMEVKVATDLRNAPSFRRDCAVPRSISRLAPIAPNRWAGTPTLLEGAAPSAP